MLMYAQEFRVIEDKKFGVDISTQRNTPESLPTYPR